MRKVKTRLTGADNLTRLVHLKRWKHGEVEVDEKEDVDENLESEGLGSGGWVRRGYHRRPTRIYDGATSVIRLSLH